MIDVIGSTQLSFMFPADRKTAYEYYLQMGQMVPHLPHIRLISTSPDNRYRLCYDTVELGAYHIQIMCDVQAEIDAACSVLRFNPITEEPEVEAKAGFNSAVTRGYYFSTSHFFDEGDQTRIEYQLDLQAELPAPLALRLVPGKVLNKITENIVNWRINEIAGGFIEGSIARFPEWLQNNHR